MNKLMSFLLLLSMGFLVSCGDEENPNLVVRSLFPTENASNVKYDTNVTINFDSDLAVESLTSQKTVAQTLGESGYVMVDENLNEISPREYDLNKLKSAKQFLAETQKGKKPSIVTIKNFDRYETVEEVKYSLTIQKSNGEPEELQISYDKSSTQKSSNPNVMTVTDQSGNSIEGDLSVNGKQLVFDPVEPLSWNTTYSVVVKAGGIKGTNGKSLGKNKTWSFRTEQQPDFKVSFANPTGAEANPLGSVVVSFSLPVEEAQFVQGNRKFIRVFLKTASSSRVCELENGEEDVAGTITTVGNLATFKPNTEFAYGRDYEICVNQEDIPFTMTYRHNSTSPYTTVTMQESRVFNFTTANPKVIAVNPDFTYRLSVYTRTITVETNFKIDPSTLNQNTVYVVDSNNQKIPAQASVKDDVFIELKLQYDENLNYDSGYILYVTSGVKGVNPNTFLAQNYFDNFTTVPRKVISSFPVQNSVNNGINTFASYKFNFPVNTASLANAIKVEQKRYGQTNYQRLNDFSFSYNDQDQEVVIYRNSSYAYAAQIKITLLTAIEDARGTGNLSSNFVHNFEIEAQDLSLVRTEPFANQTEVFVDDTVYVEFNKALDSTTVVGFPYEAATLAVYAKCLSDYVPGVIEVSGKVLNFVPDSVLPSHCDFDVFISETLRGSEGERLVGPLSYKFSTSGLEVEGVYVTQVGGYTTVDSYIDIDLNFLVDPNSVSSNTVRVENEYGERVYGTYYIDQDLITFVPDNYFEFGTVYYVTLDGPDGSTALRGLYGETLASDKSYSFETELLPLEIFDFGPTGDFVSVNAEPYITLNYSANNPNFPYYELTFEEYDFTFERYSNESFSDYVDDFDVVINPTFTMEYDTYYYVTGYFELPDGDNIGVEWEFLTETYTKSAPQKSSKVELGMKSQKLDMLSPTTGYYRTQTGKKLKVTWKRRSSVKQKKNLLK